MSSLIEKVKELQKLEEKARKPIITERTPGISSLMRDALPDAIIVDTMDSVFAFGEDMAAFHRLEEAEHYIALRNAAPDMLAVLAGFQPGDERCLKAITGLIVAVTGPETESDELDCLRRMAEMAQKMGEEK